MTTGGLAAPWHSAARSRPSRPRPPPRSNARRLPGRRPIEQYCETIPSASGPRGGDTGAAAPRPVPSTTQRELEASGTPGRELNEVLSGAKTPTAAATATASPDPGPRRTQARQARRRQAASARSDPGGELRQPAQRRALRGHRRDTVGGGFPWVLLVIAAVVGGAGWLRRTRRHDG